MNPLGVCLGVLGVSALAFVSGVNEQAGLRT
jgi:hypothetical protein